MQKQLINELGLLKQSKPPKYRYDKENFLEDSMKLSSKST